MTTGGASGEAQAGVKAWQLRAAAAVGDPPGASCGNRGLPRGSPVDLGTHPEPATGTGAILRLRVGRAVGTEACLGASHGHRGLSQGQLQVQGLPQCSAVGAVDPPSVLVGETQTLNTGK